MVGEGGAYLGAVSWVVNNSCLGFLGGGRRHFTMQGRDGEGEEGRAPGKMPGNSNLFHDDKRTKQTRAHTKTKHSTVQRLWSVSGDPQHMTVDVKELSVSLFPHTGSF